MMMPVELFRRIKEKRGFTLAEVIIASSIFVVVSTIGVMVFVNVMRIQRRITLENAIYEDGRFAMERISREIRQNTIDYEEYYRADSGLQNGENFGCYAQRFYNPGAPALIGARCNDGSDPALNPGCVINKNTLDVNTGENPYSAAPAPVPTNANALCDEPYHGDTDCALGTPTSDVNLEQQQLYLINPTGTGKTYIGWKMVNVAGEHAVAMLKLTGQDGDTDGIFETWEDIGGNNYDGFCNVGYDCSNTAVVDDLDANLAGDDSLYEGFVPLTPLRTDITRLSFFISPVEDPRKAFAETTVSEAIQQQPHVTVVMTLKAAQSELSGYAGDPPEITIQTTVGSRTYNEVKSYMGRESCT